MIKLGFIDPRTGQRLRVGGSGLPPYDPEAEIPSAILPTEGVPRIPGQWYKTQDRDGTVVFTQIEKESYADALPLPAGIGGGVRSSLRPNIVRPTVVPTNAPSLAETLRGQPSVNVPGPPPTGVSPRTSFFASGRLLGPPLVRGGAPRLPLMFVPHFRAPRFRPARPAPQSSPPLVFTPPQTGTGILPPGVMTPSLAALPRVVPNTRPVPGRGQPPTRREELPLVAEPIRRGAGQFYPPTMGSVISLIPTYEQLDKARKQKQQAFAQSLAPYDKKTHPYAKPGAAIGVGMHPNGVTVPAGASTSLTAIVPPSASSVPSPVLTSAPNFAAAPGNPSFFPRRSAPQVEVLPDRFAQMTPQQAAQYRQREYVSNLTAAFPSVTQTGHSEGGIWDSWNDRLRIEQAQAESQAIGEPVRQILQRRLDQDIEDQAMAQAPYEMLAGKIGPTGVALGVSTLASRLIPGPPLAKMAYGAAANALAHPLFVAGQDKALLASLGPEKYAALKAREAAYREQNPVGAFFIDQAPSLLLNKTGAKLIPTGGVPRIGFDIAPGFVPKAGGSIIERSPVAHRLAHAFVGGTVNTAARAIKGEPITGAGLLDDYGSNFVFGGGPTPLARSISWGNLPLGTFFPAGMGMAGRRGNPGGGGNPRRHTY